MFNVARHLATLTIPRCLCSATPLLRQCCCLACLVTDELLVAFTCRFALDIFTIIQEDYSVAAEDATPIDLELEDLH